MMRYLSVLCHAMVQYHTYYPCVLRVPNKKYVGQDQTSGLTTTTTQCARFSQRIHLNDGDSFCYYEDAPFFSALQLVLSYRRDISPLPTNSTGFVDIE